MLSGSSGRGSEPIFKRAPSSDSGGSAKRQSSSVSSSSGGGASIPSMISAGAQQQARYQRLEMDTVQNMGRNLSAVPVGLSASRQSFQVALENNPCEYFIDTM